MLWVKWITFCLLFGTALAACGMRDLKFNYAKPCNDGDDIITLSNVSAELTANCELIMSHCLEIKPYKKAFLKFELTKNDMQFMDAAFNMCDKKKMKLKAFQTFLLAFGFPTGCPVVSAKTVCFKKKKIIRVSEALMRMSVLFSKRFVSKTLVNIEHDNGKTCFEAVYEMGNKEYQ